jgi:predicted nucleic acid-binding protein
VKALLDVNILVALFDPMHVHHEAAHEWFARNRSKLARTFRRDVPAR